MCDRKKTSLLILLICLVWIPAVESGPLQVQNRFPLYLMFLSPRPVPVRPPDRGVLEACLSVDYNSVYVDEHNSQWRILMDMEMTVVDLAFAYGLSNRAAIRLEIPLVNMSGGFLDGFLENYHNALGVGNYGRENRPKNQFAYRIEKDGDLWLEGDPGGLHLADATISAQIALLPVSTGSRRQASLLAALKVPTGRSRYGFGSGRLDAALFLPIEVGSHPWSVFAMPGFIWHSDPKTRAADISARPSISFLVGTAYAYSERWRLLAQLNYFSSPVEKTGIAMIDDGGIELALGFRYHLDSRWNLEFAFCEDLFTRSAPDFNLHLGLTRSFSGLLNKK
jgi:hypothetical protein